MPQHDEPVLPPLAPAIGMTAGFAEDLYILAKLTTSPAFTKAQPSPSGTQMTRSRCKGTWLVDLMALLCRRGEALPGRGVPQAPEDELTPYSP